MTSRARRGTADRGPRRLRSSAADGGCSFPRRGRCVMAWASRSPSQPAHTASRVHRCPWRAGMTASRTGATTQRRSEIGSPQPESTGRRPGAHLDAREKLLAQRRQERQAGTNGSHRQQPRIHRARPGSPAPVRGATGPNRGSPSTPASKSPAASRTRSTAKPPTADTNRNSNSRPHRVARNRGRPRCRRRRRPPLRTHRQRDRVWTVRRLVPSCRSLVRWTRSRRVATSFASPRAAIWLR